MSATRKAPMSVESPVRGETFDERLDTIAYQVESTMRIVEALTCLALCVVCAAREDGEAVPAPVQKAAKRFKSALRGEV